MASAVSPILVLDSGLGGLTVAAALRKVLPDENILYFGDTARVPYGSKSPETVKRFMREIIRYLQPYQPKHVVIACNTATALALPSLRSEFRHLTISGVIDPGARAAALAAGRKRSPLIAVIATQATVESREYEKAIYHRRHLAQVILRPTPLLVPIIEDGRHEHDPLVKVALTQYLKPLIDRQPDVLVLGCTHYPVFRQTIAQMMGPACQVIDSAEQCAQDVAQKLTASGLVSPDGTPGQMQCFVTDDPAKFQQLATRFVDGVIDLPTWVSTEALAAGPPVMIAAA